MDLGALRANSNAGAERPAPATGAPSGTGTGGPAASQAVAASDGAQPSGGVAVIDVTEATFQT